VVRALIIHGDPAERARIGAALDRAGIEATEAADAGPQSLEEQAGGPPAVVVVAMVLPSRSGISVLQDVRRDLPATAVVVLGGPAEPELAVIALESDADDVCAPGVSDRELVLRVQRAIERRTLLGAASGPAGVVDQDGLALDRVTRTAVVDDAALDLTVKEFDLLATFASSPQRVFSRAELLELVWDADPADHSVDTVTEHVYRLRGKLDAAGSSHRWIETVRGAGYRFTMPSAGTEPVAPAHGARTALAAE
jgi:two-component system, OmpR family, response regulator ResD